MESVKKYKICCDKCKCEWDYQETQLRESQWRSKHNELLVVLSFYCPQCNEQYIVNIDNESTLAIKEEINKLQESIREALRSANGSDTTFLCYRLTKERAYWLAELSKQQNQLKEIYLNGISEAID